MKKKIAPQQLEVWTHYSGQRFDEITSLALRLADVARANGRAEPQYGYSREDWLQAEETIKNSAD